MPEPIQTQLTMTHLALYVERTVTPCHFPFSVAFYTHGYKKITLRMTDRTHLHRAAQRGDIGAVRALVEAVDVNIRGGWRVESPLHAASRAGRPDVIACLMQAGAYTEVRDRNNDTPLLLAAWLGHARAVQKLLVAGARVGAEGVPRSALHCACMQGHADCVSELLRGGADEKAADEDGNTPAQVVGTMTEAAGRTEDLGAIRAMLERAPVDRAWRRRAWLVMLRARECAAVGVLPLPPLPLTVLTRSAVRRAAYGDVMSAPLVGFLASPKSSKPPVQQKEVVTRCRRGRPAVGHGERKSSKRSNGVNAVLSGSSSRKKGRGEGKGRVGGGSDSDADRIALSKLVRSVIGLGEDGAFRCILSFL